MTQTVCDNEVIAALDSQVSCYRRLARLAELQHDYVQQSQTEQLLDVLGQRQTVLDEIASLDRAIAPIRARWSEYLAGLEPDTRERAQSLLAESRRLLEQITLADRNDALVLQQRKLSLGREINQTRAARQVNRTYAAAAYGRPRASMDVQR